MAPWGSAHTEITQDTFRLIFCNIGTWPTPQTRVSADPTEKIEELFRFLGTTQASAVACCELNTNWYSLPPDRRIHWQLRRLKHAHANVAFPRETDFDRQQQTRQNGGLVVLSLNDGACRRETTQQDPTGAARWTSTVYLGKNGKRLRYVCTYRPHKNGAADSVWTTMKRAMENQGDPQKDPQASFFPDLKKAIMQWHRNGECIVLAGDFNMAAQSQEMKDFVRECGLTNVIERHLSDEAPPSTFKFTTATGECIDSMWISQPWSAAIRRAGYLPCDFVYEKGDHMPVWADLDTNAIFGHLSPPRTPPQGRRLQLKDRQGVTRYLETLKQQYQKHNLATRLNGLETALRNERWDETCVAEMELIDACRLQCIQHADHKAFKVRVGALPYSPELLRYQAKASFWKQACKLQEASQDSLTRRLSKKYLKRLAKRAGIPFPYPRLPLEETRRRCQQAYSDYKIFKSSQSEKARYDYLGALAASYTAEGNLHQATVLRSMINTEKSRSRHAQIGSIVSPTSKSAGLTMVQIPGENGTLLDLREKTQIEKAAMSEAENRFHQASTTPPMTAPLVDFLGPDGLTTGARELLHFGKLPRRIQEQLHPTITEFLAEFKHGAVAPNELTFSLADWRSAWQAVNEKTACGGWAHFGHYKAQASDTETAAIDQRLTNLAMISGYSLRRWHNGINVLIEKEQGNYLVTKMRIILLFEPDFNMLNKFVGRYIMVTGETKSLLADENYGGRMSRAAINQVLNRRMTIDYARMMALTLVLVCVDAKSCYDRIAQNIAGLAMALFGVPSTVIQTMLSTLQHMHHFVRTAYGTSETAFCASRRSARKPASTVGQGNGNGPSLWSAVSSRLFSFMRTRGHGAKIRSPISGTMARLVGYAFVDDTDLVTIADSTTEALPITMARAQASLNDWESSLRATGGALVPAKSYFHVMNHQWIEGKQVLQTWKPDSPDLPSLFTKDEHQERLPLDFQNVKEPRKGLGVRLDLDGSDDAEYQYRREQVQSWSARFENGFLPRDLAWDAYMGRLMPMLKYPLKATCFSAAQLLKIIDPALKALLRSISFPSTYPQDLLFGSTAYHGIGIPDLYVYQGACHVEHVVKVCHSKDSEGLLLRADLEALCLLLGAPGNIFQLEFSVWSQLIPNTWLRHVWAFLDEHEIRVHAHDIGLPADDEVDFYLMPRIWNTKVFSLSEFTRVNRCRVYLQVLRVTDVILPEARRLNPNMWAGYRDIQGTAFDHSTYDWPAQQKPSKADWILWRKALSVIFQIDDELDELPMNLRLLTHHQPVDRARWRWIADEKLLVQSKKDSWLFVQLDRGCLTPLPVAIVNCPRAFEPTEAIRGKFRASPEVCWYQVRNQWQLRCWRPRPHDSGPRGAQPTSVLSFSEAALHLLHTLSQDPKWGWTCQKPTLTVSPTRPIGPHREILSGVSDGSWRPTAPEFGSAYWYLHVWDPHTHEVWELAGAVESPRGPSKQDSFRCEVAGIFSMIRIACELFPLLRTMAGTSELLLGPEFRCDGYEAIRKALDTQYYLDTTDAHYDLLVSLRSCLKTQWTGPPIRWAHVKGHEDRHRAFHLLDHYSKQNVRCDAGAKLYLDTVIVTQSPLTPDIIPGEPWQVWMDGCKLTSHFTSSITKRIAERRARKYWSGKGVSWDLLCTTEFGKASKFWDRSKSLFLSKLATKKNPVGDRMASTYKFWRESRCPQCLQLGETQHHFVQCVAASVGLRAALDDLEQRLEELGTGPSIGRFLLQSLRYVVYDQEVPAPQNYLLQDIWNGQSQVGWTAMLDGRFSTAWMAGQADYLGESLFHSPSSWMTQVIIAVTEFSWQMWHQRNETLHQGARRLRTRWLDQDIHGAFETGFESFSTHILRRLQQDKATVLAFSFDKKTTWLGTVKRERERLATPAIDARINWEIALGFASFPPGLRQQCSTARTAILAWPLPKKQKWLTKVSQERSRQRTREIDLQTAIQTEFDQGFDLFPDSNRDITMTLDTIMTWPRQRKQNWLKRIQRARQQLPLSISQPHLNEVLYECDTSAVPMINGNQRQQRFENVLTS